jgi:phospholipase/carboxylesterase
VSSEAGLGGWTPDLQGRKSLRVFIAHGRLDPVIGVQFARRARELLEGAGLEVAYHESEVGHQIDPRLLPAAAGWLLRVTALQEEHRVPPGP